MLLVKTSARPTSDVRPLTLYDSPACQVSGPLHRSELFQDPSFSPHTPPVTLALVLAAVILWPTCTSVFHIWSCLRTCAEVYWCWQAFLTGHWCAYVCVFESGVSDHWNVCVCVLPHLAAGKTLLWELKGPAVRSHAHTLAQLLLEASWGQQCFPVLSAVGKREDRTWRSIAQTWCRSLRAWQKEAGELESNDTGMKGGRVQFSFITFADY